MATSHIDALCHVFVRRDDVQRLPRERREEHRREDATTSWWRATGSPGAACCSTCRACAGVPWLELDERIRPADLEAAERAQRVRVEEGDILLVSTGRDARRASARPVEPERRGARRAAPHVHPVAPRAPDRRARQRRHLGRLPGLAIAALAGARAPVLPRRDGRAPARQPRSRRGSPRRAPSASAGSSCSRWRRCACAARARP